MLRGCLNLIIKSYLFVAVLGTILAAAYGPPLMAAAVGVFALVVFAIDRAIFWYPGHRLKRRANEIRALVGDDYPVRYFYGSEGIAVSTDQKKIRIVRSSDVIEQYNVSQVSAVDVFAEGRARCALKLTVRDPESPICTVEFGPKDREAAQEFRMIIESMMK